MTYVSGLCALGGVACFLFLIAVCSIIVLLALATAYIIRRKMLAHRSSA
jgi:heme exporter protein D